MKRVDALITGAVPKDWMDRLDSFSESDDHTAIIVNAEMVHGMVHIESAVEHAERAFSQKMNRSRDLEVETILYLTGERRIEKALEMSAPGDRNVVIAVDCDVRQVMDVLGTTGEEVPSKTDGTLDAIERTALLDIDK